MLNDLDKHVIDKESIYLVDATNGERRKEAHCRDCTSGTMFVPSLLAKYGARLDDFSVKVCIFSVSRVCDALAHPSDLLYFLFVCKCSFAPS